jgi:predicted HTH domain antitoxin
MAKSVELHPEVVKIVRSHLKEAAQDQRLLEWAVLGFEAQLSQLYRQFQRGEISFGYLAEALGISSWEAESLLEKRGLHSSNL